MREIDEKTARIIRKRFQRQRETLLRQIEELEEQLENSSNLEELLLSGKDERVYFHNTRRCQAEINFCKRKYCKIIREEAAGRLPIGASDDFYRKMNEERARNFKKPYWE